MGSAQLDSEQPPSPRHGPALVLALLAVLCGCGGPLEEAKVTEQETIDQAPAPRAKPIEMDGITLPAGAVSRMGDVRWRSHDSSFVAHYLADGTLLTAGVGGVVRAWDAEGRLRWSSTATGFMVSSVKPALGGAALVVAGWDPAVLVLNAKDRSVTRRLRAGHGIAKPIAISLDGGLLAVDEDVRETAVWDLKTGERLRVFPDPIGHSNARCFLPPRDGRQRVVIGTNPLRSFDALTGKALAEGPTEPGFVDDVALDPSGTRLVVVGAGFVEELDPDTLTRRSSRRTKVHAQRLAFHPRGNLVAFGDYDGRLWRWDLAGDPVLIEERDDDHTVYDLSFSPDGSRLAVVREGEFRPRFFAVDGWAEIDASPDAIGMITRIAVSPAGNLIATNDHGIALWDVAKRRVVNRLGQGVHRKGVVAIAFSADGRHLVGTDGNDLLCRWDLSTGTHQDVHLGFTADDLSVTSDAIIAGGKGRVTVLDPATLAERWSMAAPDPKGDAGIRRAAWSPLGILVHERDWIRLIDPVTRSTRHSFKLDNPEPTYSSFAGASAGGRLVFTRQNGLRILDLAQGRLVACVYTGGLHLTLSPDGRYIAYCDEERVVVLDAETARPLACAPGPVKHGAVAFSPDGKVLYSAGPQGEVITWEMKALLGQ